MTTKVTVFAHAGWAVDVFPISTPSQPSQGPTRVESGATRDFYVHAGQDLLIREVDLIAGTGKILTKYLQLLEKGIDVDFEALRSLEGVDGRMLAIAKTQMELGALALVRALRDVTKK